MGDVPASTTISTHPLVVSSTTPKEVEKSYIEYSLTDKGGRLFEYTHSTAVISQNPKSVVETPSQQHKPSLQPTLQDGYSEGLHQEGSRTLPTDTSHHNAISEMADPSYSMPTAHPQYRYPSGYPTMVTHGYPTPGIAALAPPANTVYFPYSNNRYPPVYYSPYVPPYSPQTITVAQIPPQQPTYFYAPGYPQSFPPTLSSVSSPSQNAPHSQTQLHSMSPRWHQGQPVAQYVYMTNPFVQHPAPQPMQASYSHPAHSAPPSTTQSFHIPPPYSRRHSHPLRAAPMRARVGDTDQLPASAWGQNMRSTSVHGGSQSTANSFNSPVPTPDSSRTYGSILPIQNNTPQFSPLTDRSASSQSAETPSSSLLITITTKGHSFLPRGPPRKPRQSGHALWVGNLPPGSTVIDLKDHFSREATKDIESVFLISKSNCAFINYKTDAACTAAMLRFHDNRFKGVRLVCRLRRDSATSTSGSIVTRERLNASSETLSSGEGAGLESNETVSDGTGPSFRGESSDTGKGKDEDARDKLKNRVFILKSLTVEDLDLSVKNGVWSTQSHNEKNLNRAFETSENVYLIFSANKSGEYYGYARMASRIPENDVEESDGLYTSATPRIQRVVSGGLPEALLPKAIFTPASATAPEGWINDDSARGTIFWEAAEEELADGDAAPGHCSDKLEDTEELVGTTKSWGKPFNVQWISTTKLPFHKTRGLRNSWNSNREVKIARDGTEVEEAVGRRLLQMFHRGATNTPVAN